MRKQGQESKLPSCCPGKEGPSVTLPQRPAGQRSPGIQRTKTSKSGTLAATLLGVRLDGAGPGGQGGPHAGDGAQGPGKDLGTRDASVPGSPLLGVPSKMLGMWSLLLLLGLATPCQGLLEKVGTLARIDKDELGKGEPEAGSVDVALIC